MADHPQDRGKEPVLIAMDKFLHRRPIAALELAQRVLILQRQRARGLLARLGRGINWGRQRGGIGCQWMLHRFLPLTQETVNGSRESGGRTVNPIKYVADRARDVPRET